MKGKVLFVILYLIENTKFMGLLITEFFSHIFVGVFTDSLEMLLSNLLYFSSYSSCVLEAVMGPCRGESVSDVS